MGKEATKTVKKEDKNIKIKNGDLFTLYTILNKLKCNQLKKESMVKYIPLRVKLKGIFDQYEKIRTEASDQTKPDGFDDMTESQKNSALIEWESKITPILSKWFGSDLEKPIDTKIFSMDELVDFFNSNPDLVGDQMDVITTHLLKD